ncbi:MAG: ABC transporter ATP-binding protein [Spirochaetales bacterium]|nr:ABC transporter ATP-binding protein [Spirochaetales bacterium]
MIVIQNLTRRYGGFTALDRINLTIQPGQIFGLLGPNGAGKSTTVKCLTGSIKPSEGDIFINSINIKEEPVKAKSLLGYVPENPILFKNLTAREYLILSGRLYRMDEDSIKRRSSELLENFGLIDKADQQILSYSKGMVQKLVLASALLHNPAYYILDEPFSGLDASTQAVLKETIRSLADRGKTVIFCSHILEVVEKLCHQLAVIHQGKVLALGTPEEITKKSGCSNLEDAFIKLNGERNIKAEADQLISSLE